jgi:eukaryotic-like serine/threonine-protein kinase
MQFTSDIPIRLGQVIEGKYRIERILGQGGMGVVVQATHLVLEQCVAMKFLLPSVATNEEVAARFLREAKAAIKIRSEHVARIMDVSGTDTDIPFLVMEYLHGKDLSAIIKQRGSLPFRDAVGYVLQACEALGEAHAQGIVHRDLKPANLFLTTRADGTDCVKVLDFGISKVAAGGDGSSLTRTRGMMGSPLYMSPEQARSARDATTRSDIWSMGIVLYELLTGSTPFKGESVMELCSDLLNTFPPPPSSLRPELPEALDAVVMRCIEKEPSNRFDNVAELAGALVPFGVEGAWESARVTARVLGIRPLAGAGRVVEMPPTEPVPQLKPTLPEGSPVVPPRADETVGSWGATHRSLRVKSKAGTKVAIVAAGLAIVSLIVGASLFWLRSSSSATAGAQDGEQVGLVASTSPRPAGSSAPARPDSTEPDASNERGPSAAASNAKTPPAAASSSAPLSITRPPPRPPVVRVEPPALTRPPPRPPAVRVEPPALTKPPPSTDQPPAPKSDLDLFNDNK